MLGYICILVYCFSIAGTSVFAKHGNYDNSLLLFTSCLFALLVFGLLTLKDTKKLSIALKKNRGSLIGMNVATAVAWIFSYMYGLLYIDASTFLSIELGSVPVIAFFALTPLKDYKKKGFSLLALFAILFSMGVIIYQNMQVNKGQNDYLIGGGFAFLSGMGLFFVTYFSEKLGKAKFSTPQIIFFRTPILFLYAIFLLFQRESLQTLTKANVKPLCITALVASCLIPLLYIQAIKKIGTFKVSMWIPLTPIFAYFLQLYIGNYAFHLYTFAALLFSCVAILSFNIAAYFHKE